MKTTRSSRRAAAAFTLIELLTVIAIIAVLMGLLLPAIGAARETARKTRAKNDVTGIVAAVKHYYTEYGKYPTLEAPGGGGGNNNNRDEDAVVGDPEDDAQYPNSALFNTLRALPIEPNTEHRLNPRKIVFYENRNVSNPKQPRDGFVDVSSGGQGGGGNSGGDEEKKGCLFDPWGKQYFVVIDSNYDGVIEVDKYYSDFSGTDVQSGKAPRVGVGAFTLGKDNEYGKEGDKRFRDEKTNEQNDDIVSWAL